VAEFLWDLLGDRDGAAEQAGRFNGKAGAL
jgi:hypothetical protein